MRVKEHHSDLAVLRKGNEGRSGNKNMSMLDKNTITTTNQIHYFIALTSGICSAAAISQLMLKSKRVISLVTIIGIAAEFAIAILATTILVNMPIG